MFVSLVERFFLDEDHLQGHRVYEHAVKIILYPVHSLLRELDVEMD
jgi:hypothetical protein